MKKLNPRVFRDAAESIRAGRTRHCCTAIDEIEYDGEHLRFFVKCFCPRSAWDGEPWWGLRYAEELDWDERREARILALLLCAEMCKR